MKEEKERIEGATTRERAEAHHRGGDDSFARVYGEK
jgi:hypothetical protein